MDLLKNIEARFAAKTSIMEDIERIFKRATSSCSFHSPEELAGKLTEGNYLNFRDNTYLVGESHKTDKNSELVRMLNIKTLAEHLVTKDSLLKQWKQFTIGEDAGMNAPSEGPPQGNPGGTPGESNEHSKPEGSGAEPFQSQIQTDTVERFQLMKAMQDGGYTVTGLAEKVNVDPPAISRLLRTPKESSSDPGGRNPSVELASEICKVLRIDPVTAFPDIFGNRKQYSSDK